MSQTHGGPPAKGFWRTSGAVLEGLGAALIVGGSVATFVVAHVVFDSRDQFQRGDVGPFLTKMFTTIFIYVTSIGAALMWGSGTLFSLRVRNVAALTAVLAMLAQAYVLSALDAVRLDAGGSIEKVARDDPRRIEFGKLHGESMALGIVALACGITVIVCKARTEQ